MPDPEGLKKTKAAALKYLSYRDRSVHEVAERLAEKDHSQSEVKETIAWLKKLGYLDDERFALHWGRSRIAAKNIGEYRLRRELSQKGLTADTVDKTAQALYSEFDEWELAQSCAEKKLARLRGIAREAQYRRLVQHLQRKGFSSDTVFKMVNKLLPKTATPETTTQETQPHND